MKRPRKTSSVRAANAASPATLHRTPRVLIADDEEIIRLVGLDALSRIGYDVDVVADGAAAWDAIQRIRYDLIITDHHMPEMTGVELLKRLHAAGNPLPVILVAGILPTDELINFPWLKPAAMLVKPYTIPDFLRVVGDVLHTTDGADDLFAPSPLKKTLPAPRWRKR